MLPRRTQLLLLMSYQVRDSFLCVHFHVSHLPPLIVDIESPDFDLEKYIVQLEKQEAK